MLEGYFRKDDSNELLKRSYKNVNYKSIHGLGMRGGQNMLYLLLWKRALFSG